jgi:hypothetical protein
MPEININVETNYVTEVSTTHQVNQEANSGDEGPFSLVDKHDFIRLFRARFPASRRVDPTAIWDNLFGNHSTGNPNGISPYMRYLTGQSCEKIFQHLKLFNNGIDFQHLPAGFFITKNPYAGGVCNVLHYSEYIETYQPKLSPLSIVLSNKSTEESLSFAIHFEEPKASWYRFLDSKRIGTDGTTYCTKQELHAAFIYFTTTLQRLGLEFYSEDFSAARFTEDVNPIVLLGRWQTTLTNRHLRKSDLLAQWQVLPKLPLTTSSEAIRAITDYENDERACGFILPEMELTEEGFNFEEGFRDIHEYKNIKNERDFWRYLTFQPRRNSLTFYQHAAETIEAMNFGDYAQDKWALYQILAASTTRMNHMPLTATSEAEQLEKWRNL